MYRVATDRNQFNRMQLAGGFDVFVGEIFGFALQIGIVIFRVPNDMIF